MDHALRFFALATLFSSVTAFSQTLALDTPTDPRSVATGESFVAVTGNPAGLMYNPAGIARVRGATASYALRQFNYTSWMDERQYQSASITVNTAAVSLGAMYERDYYGEFPVTNAYYPDGIGTEKVYDHLFGLGAGVSLGEHWDVGLAGKMFEHSVGIGGGSGVSIETTPAFMADAGVIYRLYHEAAENHHGEAFTAGLSVQNLGTDFKRSMSGPGQNGSRQVVTVMPRYLRVGVAYALTKRSTAGTLLVPFQLQLSSGVRYLLNPEATSTPNSGRGLGVGFGADGLIYELVSIRLGAQKIPDNSVYVGSSGWTLRFGAGLNVPFRLMGISVPLVLQGDYAAIPVRNDWIFLEPGPPPETRSLLHNFSLTLRYEEDLF